MDMNLNRLQEGVETEEPGMLQSMGSQRIAHNLAAEQQNGRQVESVKESHQEQSGVDKPNIYISISRFIFLSTEG